jgi:Tol biopolymer transport system component
MTTTKLKLLPFALGLVALAGLTFALSLPDTTARPATVPVAPVPKPRPPVFLVEDRGCAILDPDGKEIERFKGTTNGALSPDGAWVACVEFPKEDNPNRNCKLVIRPRGHPAEQVTVPRDLGQPGTSGAGIVWSRDGRRLLINDERSWMEDDSWVSETKFWVYDVAANQVTDLKLPNVRYVYDWSPDSKRLLASASVPGKRFGLAWVNLDGTGDPEFITPVGEGGYDGHLSPDGKRILYQGRTRSWLGHWNKPRLYVLDIATKQRKAVDEPGETLGFCWSPDGTRIAYTWQRTRENWAEHPERETLLITCDPDGGNRTVVTSRKTTVGKNDSSYACALIFFQVRDWR